jgi:hypothetical protein
VPKAIVGRQPSNGGSIFMYYHQSKAMWAIGVPPFPLAINSSSYTPDTAGGHWMAPTGAQWHYSWEAQPGVRMQCLVQSAAPTLAPSNAPSHSPTHPSSRPTHAQKPTAAPTATPKIKRIKRSPSPTHVPTSSPSTQSPTIAPPPHTMPTSSPSRSMHPPKQSMHPSKQSMHPSKQSMHPFKPHRHGAASNPEAAAAAERAVYESQWKTLSQKWQVKTPPPAPVHQSTTGFGAQSALSGVLVLSCLALGMWIQKRGGRKGPCTLNAQYDSSDDEGGELRTRPAANNRGGEQQQPLKGYSSV